MAPSQNGPAALFIGVELSSVYVDLGASCTDKNRAHQVWTTGDVVNLHKPGKYAVKYECTTISGAKAMSAIREVNVIQHPSYKQLSKNGPGNETPGPPTANELPHSVPQTCRSCCTRSLKLSCNRNLQRPI